MSTAPTSPGLSALQHLSQASILEASPPHPPDLLALATQIRHNLQHQHRWTALQLHTHDLSIFTPLPRPLLSGLPPKRLYISPDEQAALLKAGEDGGEPRREWVLPTRLVERWSLKRFAEVFDGIGDVPSGEGEEGRVKRVLLGITGDDGTIVYYFMHDGIVKPRQN